MVIRYDYYIVDRLGFYYAGHRDGFADYTKDISEAKKFWSEFSAEMACQDLGVSFRVVAVQREVD